MGSLLPLDAEHLGKTEPRASPADIGRLGRAEEAGGMGRQRLEGDDVAVGDATDGSRGGVFKRPSLFREPQVRRGGDDLADARLGVEILGRTAILPS
jgi:hypothetical protein